ncbi:MAG: MotE family protein [Paracoccaceae bacterium]
MKLRRILAGRGALAMLALMLAASGALRLGHGVGTAMALQASEDPAIGSKPLQCPEPPAALALALKERDAAITAREAALQDRLAALSLADEALTRRLTELEATETTLRQTLAIADGAAEKDLQRLTAVYEAMKPAEASALFEAMAPEFAAGFLGRMRPDVGAAIIAGLKPETAYTISVLIAGRNALAPKE